MESIKIDWFRSLDGLPSLPAQILNVLEELNRISSMDYNIVEMIQFDAAIAVRILKVANTPLYGYNSQISSLKQAAGLLGPGAIKNIVLTTPILERFRGNGYVDTETDYAKLWRHFAIAAALSGELARRVGGLESDVCFTAGLIHGIGRVTLAVYHPLTLSSILKTASNKKISLLQAEREVLGFTHGDIGAEMFSAWSFPHILIQAVKNCSRTDLEETEDRIAAVVCLSRYLTCEWGYPDGFEDGKDRSMDGVFSLLGITDRDLKEWEPKLRGCVSLAAETVRG